MDSNTICFLTYTLKKNGVIIEEMAQYLNENTNVSPRFRGYSIMDLLEDIISLNILQKISLEFIDYLWDDVDVKFTSFYITGNIEKFQREIRKIIGGLEEDIVIFDNHPTDKYTVSFCDIVVDKDNMLDIKEPCEEE